MGTKERDGYMPDLSGMPIMLTKPEVMAIIRSSLSGVNRLIANGQLAAFRIGKRKTLVSRASVESLLSHPLNK